MAEEQKQANPQCYSLDKYAQCYLQKMRTSRGCRFLAQRRLTGRNHASQLVVSFYSVAVIAASVGLLIVDPQQEKLARVINVLAINASVFIIVLSNLEFAKNYAVQAEKMLRGALALSKICDDLELALNSGPITKEKLEKFVDDYNQVHINFEANHEDIDYLYFCCTHSDQFPDHNYTGFRKWLIRSRYFLHVWGLYILAIVVPPSLILFGAHLIHSLFGS